MTSTKVHKPFDLEAAKRGEPIMMADGSLYVGGTHYTHVAARWSPSSWLCSALNYVKPVTVEIEE